MDITGRLLEKLEEGFYKPMTGRTKYIQSAHSQALNDKKSSSMKVSFSCAVPVLFNIIKRI